MLRFAVAVCCWGLLSTTFAVKENVPVWVGVPVIAPVDTFRFSPGGNDPVFDHVYGDCPPVAASDAEYAVLT